MCLSEPVGDPAALDVRSVLLRGGEWDVSLKPQVELRALGVWCLFSVAIKLRLMFLKCVEALGSVYVV